MTVILTGGTQGGWGGEGGSAPKNHIHRIWRGRNNYSKGGDAINSRGGAKKF